MKELMDRWRRLVLEAKEEDEKELLDSSESDDEPIQVRVGDGEEEEIEEWNAEDDDEYPSRKKRKRNSKMLKPDRASWNAGYSQLKSLAKGKVGLDSHASEEGNEVSVSNTPKSYFSGL